jgi:hypothetical protein
MKSVVGEVKSSVIDSCGTYSVSRGSDDVIRDRPMRDSYVSRVDDDVIRD